MVISGRRQGSDHWLMGNCSGNLKKKLFLQFCLVMLEMTHFHFNIPIPEMYSCVESSVRPHLNLVLLFYHLLISLKVSGVEAAYLIYVHHKQDFVFLLLSSSFNT